MRVLVTGGAGFIGSHLAEELVRRGHEVRVLDNFSTGRRENMESFRKKITLIEADIRDRRAVDSAVRGTALIFHEAAAVSVAESFQDPQATMEVNVNGALNVFEAAVKHRVKKVVYASSCAVYGDAGRRPLKETTFPKPLSFYALSKWMNEESARLFGRHFKLRTAGLRYFNVFGPRQRADSPYSGVIALFLKKFGKHETPVIFGDGKQTRDFIYVKDVVRANILAARGSQASGAALNVGTGRSVSINELVKYLNRLLGTGIKPRYEKPRPGDIRHSAADTNYARRTLKFSPQFPFFKALKMTGNFENDFKKAI